MLLATLRECDQMRIDVRIHHRQDHLCGSRNLKSVFEAALADRRFPVGVELTGHRTAAQTQPDLALPLVLSRATSLVAISIKALSLGGGEALAPLSPLRQLRVLRLEEMPRLQTEALRALQACTQLQLVSFSGCSELDDRAASFLMPMTKLQ